MKKTSKAIIAFLFYKVKIKEPFKWKKEQNRFEFTMHPRKYVVIPVFILFSPLIVLFGGLFTLKQSWKDTMKVQAWSSYAIDLPVGEFPKKFECYKRF